MKPKSQIEYRAWAAEYEDLPLFFQPWWLDFTTGGPSNWGVAIYKEKDQIKGIFTYFLTRRLGLRSISMPLLTPFMGPWIIYPDDIQKSHSKISYEIRVLEGLFQKVPKVYFFKQKWHYQFHNFYPLYWKNYRASTNYTYLLAPLSDLDSIWNNFSGKLRAKIKKERISYKIIEYQHIEALFQIQRQRFISKKQKSPFSLNMLSELWALLQAQQGGKIFHAIDRKSGKLAAALLLVFDKNEAYLIISGFEKNENYYSAMPLLIWHSIQSASQLVDRYNFEGSMLKEIEQFYRYFGGELKAYQKITKINILIIRDWLAKV